MTTLWQDVRYGMRMLGKSPGFTAIALITLAIGIGANTIMFSVVNSLLLRPLSVKDSDRLVGCRSRPDYVSCFFYPTFVGMRDGNSIFSDLTGYSDGEFNLRCGDNAGRVYGYFVAANYFSTLGASPLMGRGFLPGEDDLAAEAVAVLAYQAWERFGADPNVIDKQVFVDGLPCRVVGVMPKGFTGVSLIGPDVWVPLGLYYQALPDTDRIKQWPERFTDENRYPMVHPLGRLKPGLSLPVAEAQLKPLAAQLEIKRGLYLYHPSRFVGSDDQLAYVCAFFQGTSLLVLLIACLNLANMYAVQGALRQRELVIRVAMGSSRWRIVRQLLVESMLLATLGGIGGLMVAFWGMRILDASLASLRLPVAIGLALQGGFDIRVLGATAAFTTAAALLSGLWPALRLSRHGAMVDMREVRGGVFRSAGRGRRLLPGGLSVAGQIALSVVLVMGASLFTHSAVRAAYATPGYSLNNKLLISVDLDGTRYNDAQRQQLCRRLIERVSTLPGVQAVGLSNSIPFGDGHGVDYVSIQGKEIEDDDLEAVMRRGVRSYSQGIAGDYFQAVGLPLLRGRPFTTEESTSGAPVAIVDEALARRLRPDGEVLGCLVSGSREIVGIVPNVRHGILKRETETHIYHPFGSRIGFVFLTMHLANSSRAVEAGLLQQIPKEIRGVDPLITVLSATTLTEHLRHTATMWFVGMLARLGVVFGAVALFLAGLGIYGVKGHLVASRTPEIGIRMALGATRRGVLAMILREGSVVTLVGLAMGMWAALAIIRLTRSVLCDIDPVDPLSIAATVGLLGGVSLLAGYLPARRAARIDPMVALRCE